MMAIQLVKGLSNTISVISAMNDEKIKDIRVGEHPEDIEIVDYEVIDGSEAYKIYVSHPDSNSISVISDVSANDTKIKDIEVGVSGKLLMLPYSTKGMLL